MAKAQENNLTVGTIFPIVLSEDEERIITNLREHAEFVKHGEFTVTFKVHDSALKSGDLKLSETIKRM